jgi:4-hydroxy-3-methylbut-2-en-1-yl diphosphate reductase
MKIAIDKHSGFCFGVINAIKTAESYLAENNTLFCLGDIVHNNEEVKRLTNLGLVIVSREEFEKLHDTTVLIRAHGEPPETYEIARKNNVHLVDTTCQVVLNLQKNIKMNYQESIAQNGQILIFGKEGHAEVVGLLGQTRQNGIVISSIREVDKIDFTRPSRLYSQTTQSVEDYSSLIEKIKSRYHQSGNDRLFQYSDTICRLVANRSQQIRSFAEQYDKIIFVSGEKSSNGLYLFGLCKKANPNSFFISKPEQIDDISFDKDESVGICGATSTPMWLMEQVEQKLLKME